MDPQGHEYTKQPSLKIISQQSDRQAFSLYVTFIRHHYMFRTHPDINTARMTFNHQLSIEWQVCTPPHFNLQYTQHVWIDS